MNLLEACVRSEVDGDHRCRKCCFTPTYTAPVMFGVQKNYCSSCKTRKIIHCVSFKHKPPSLLDTLSLERGGRGWGGGWKVNNIKQSVVPLECDKSTWPFWSSQGWTTYLFWKVNWGAHCDLLQRRFKCKLPAPGLIGSRCWQFGQTMTLALRCWENVNTGQSIRVVKWVCAGVGFFFCFWFVCFKKCMWWAGVNLPWGLCKHATSSGFWNNVETWTLVHSNIPCKKRRSCTCHYRDTYTISILYPSCTELKITLGVPRNIII